MYLFILFLKLFLKSLFLVFKNRMPVPVSHCRNQLVPILTCTIILGTLEGNPIEELFNHSFPTPWVDRNPCKLTRLVKQLVELCRTQS